MCANFNFGEIDGMRKLSQLPIESAQPLWFRRVTKEQGNPPHSLLQDVVFLSCSMEEGYFYDRKYHWDDTERHRAWPQDESPIPFRHNSGIERLPANPKLELDMSKIPLQQLGQEQLIQLGPACSTIRLWGMGRSVGIQRHLVSQHRKTVWKRTS